jgi:hypothetical protein
MKIFISWSGAANRTVAQLLKESLAKLIQAVKLWMSGDIKAVSRWSVGVTAELRDSQFDILCLTSESLTASWLLFEAGTLSKTLNNTFAVPFLIHITPGDVR